LIGRGYKERDEYLDISKGDLAYFRREICWVRGIFSRSNRWLLEISYVDDPDTILTVDGDESGIVSIGEAMDVRERSVINALESFMKFRKEIEKLRGHDDG